MVYPQIVRLCIDFCLWRTKFVAFRFCFYSSSKPGRLLWKLLWPIPWKFSLRDLLDPLEIWDDPRLVHLRYHVETNYNNLRGLPLFQRRDTPLGSLYRIHDAVCADNARP